MAHQPRLDLCTGRPILQLRSQACMHKLLQVGMQVFRRPCPVNLGPTIAAQSHSTIHSSSVCLRHVFLRPNGGCLAAVASHDTGAASLDMAQVLQAQVLPARVLGSGVTRASCAGSAENPACQGPPGPQRHSTAQAACKHSNHTGRLRRHHADIHMARHACMHAYLRTASTRLAPCMHCRSNGLTRIIMK
jgi:hypothetical protein